MKPGRIGFKGACAALAWFALAGAAPAAPDTPALADLISRLADPSFRAREHASGKILAHGRLQPRETQEELAAAYRHSADPEIRFRSKAILIKLFAESIGFLGVHYQNREFLNPRGERQLGVVVAGVAPGSPAKVAGLRPGDLILAIDRKAINPAVPDQDFSKRIQALGAGRTVTLTYSRGEKDHDVKVTLGARPFAPGDAEAETLFNARLRDIEAMPAKQ